MAIYKDVAKLHYNKKGRMYCNQYRDIVNKQILVKSWDDVTCQNCFSTKRAKEKEKTIPQKIRYGRWGKIQ